MLIQYMCLFVEQMTLKTYMCGTRFALPDKVLLDE
jgi:hypothetical protein